MLVKYLDSCSGRRSYCVGKVLMQFIKSSEGYRNNLNIISTFRSVNTISKESIKSKVSMDETLSKNCDENKTPRKKQSRPKVADEIYSYLKDACPAYILNMMPKKYFKRRGMLSEDLRLVHPKAADTIVECIKRNVVKEGNIILEANPGIGILSKKLIEAGVCQLHLHEPSSTFQKILKGLKYEHYEKIALHQTDFLSLSKFAFQDKMDQGNRVMDILSHYPKKKWNEEPSLVIIGCILSSDFIKHIILGIVFETGLMAHCRPEMYLLMSPTLHLRLTCSGKDGYLRYRTITVLFQLFFDYELLEKVPRKHFLPWPVPISRKKRQVSETGSLDMDWLHLVKIVPKKDLYERIPPDKMPGLWYFVRHHFWRRSRKIIPDIESWIPGCGIRLILDGYNIYTEFGDLSPEEALHIFLQFSNWPEYQDSSFLSSLESALLKLDENPDENVEKPESVGETDDNANDQELQ